jgi:hypothetical protein
MLTKTANTEKTAELVADNKLTILHLYNLANERETEFVMPYGFNRVQEVLDWLNDPELGNDYVCLGWHYEYRPHEEEF